MITKRKAAICLALTSMLAAGAGQSLAQTDNTMYGEDALSNNEFGNSNSAFGYRALYFNTTGEANTASGSLALYSNTSGRLNTANGSNALRRNTTGNRNTASGFWSLYSNISGEKNVASGYSSLYSNSTGDRNTAYGADSLFANTTGSNNTANGFGSLFSSRTGSFNTASGYYSLGANTTGTDNTAVGNSALYENTSGKLNTALGSTAMYENVSGKWNNSVGGKSLYSITTGNGNSAQGFSALYNITTGSNNMAIGNTAGYNNKTGSGNVFLGWNAGFSETGSNKLYITNNQATPLLYGVFATNPSNTKLGIGTQAVGGDDAIAVWNGAHLTKGGVWTNASSRELKDNIEALSAEDANAALEALSPVRYVYKNSRDEEYVGFIAEDVPELVASGDHKSLSPMDIVAVLTKVAKEQRAQLSEQQTKMAEKDAEIDGLRDALANQDERIVQMEMSLAEVLQNQPAKLQVGSR